MAQGSRGWWGPWERSGTWEARETWGAATAADVAVVQEQLRRPVSGLLGVAARCRWGKPIVIVSPPLLVRTRRRTHRVRPEWEPFPNLLWLSCPYLAAAVSGLESEGWISRWRRQVETDAELRSAVAAAHRQYAKWRWEAVQWLAGTDERAREWLAVHPAAVQVLKETGVGGARDGLAVKCLHAHLAHHLAGGRNPLGQWVTQELARRGVDVAGDPACRSEERCAGREPE